MNYAPSYIYIFPPKRTPVFKSCELGLNQRPKELQSPALPTELSQEHVLITRKILQNTCVSGRATCHIWPRLAQQSDAIVLHTNYFRHLSLHTNYFAPQSGGVTTYTNMSYNNNNTPLVEHTITTYKLICICMFFYICTLALDISCSRISS